MSLFKEPIKREVKEIKYSSTQFNDESILIFQLMELIANKHYDGHYTIMKFTTNYRFCFGTLHIKNDTEYRVAISLMAEGKTLDEAILKAIVDEVDTAKINKQLPKAIQDFENNVWN